MRLRLRVALALALVASVAHASPITVVEAARAGSVAVGPALPLHRRITCTTTAAPIVPQSGSAMISYECTAKGVVVVGSFTGADASTALTAANGVEFAAGDRWGANVRVPESCITASGTAEIQCRFLVSSR